MSSILHDKLKRRTILQVLPALNAGGVEATTVEVAQALVKVGAQALVASAGGRLESQLKELGGQSIRLPLNTKNPFKLIANTLSLIRLIKDAHVDLVHVRSRAPAWSALWAARWCGIPFLTTFHGTYNYKGFLKKFYNAVMARGDLVIANSRFIAGHMRAHYNTPTERIRIIPRGVDCARFDPNLFDAVSCREQLHAWGIEDTVNKPVILLPGRLTPWKGQLVFLEALSKLSHRNFWAVLAGDDQGRTEYRRKLENYIHEKKLDANVKIVGHSDSMPRAYAAIDLVVSASTDPEAFGRVMAEALAMERPVVATHHGGAIEILEGQEGGILVPPKDARSMSRALEIFLALTPEVLENIGRKSRLYIQNTFTTERLTQATLNVYLELLLTGKQNGRKGTRHKA